MAVAHWVTGITAEQRVLIFSADGEGETADRTRWKDQKQLN